MMHVTQVPVTPFQQNCCVLRCDVSGKGAIVDPGGELERILAVVEEQDVEIEQILLTHGHLDHAGAAQSLARKLELPIIGPQEDETFWLDQMLQQAEMFGVPSAGVEVCKPDRFLEHGDTVDVGEIQLQVLHCPGHTPGHVAFFDPESRVVILGDLLFRGSIGRTDFPRGDHATLIRSLFDNILPLGDDVTFYSGHGPTGTLGEERLTNPFLLNTGL